MSEKNKIKILILAAGKGKRMQSDLPKILLPLKGKRMIDHVLKSIEKINIGKPIAIIGHQAELVRSELKDQCDYALQEEQLGTGHAVASAKNNCEGAENIIVLSGDQPFISSETIINLIEKHTESGAKITFATSLLTDFNEWRSAFFGFGRILRENKNPSQEPKVIGIKEYKDANDEEKNIKEVNAGCYMFEADWLWKNLEKIKNENAQSEYYLTDLLGIAWKNGDKIETIKIKSSEALSANTREELAILENFVF